MKAIFAVLLLCAVTFAVTEAQIFNFRRQKASKMIEEGEARIRRIMAPILALGTVVKLNYAN